MIHVDPTDPAVLAYLVESLDDEKLGGLGVRDLARAALAALEDVSTAGWSRPRWVTTAAELEALPVGTRIMHEASGLIYYRVQYRNPHTPSWEWRMLRPGRGHYLLTSELAGLPYVVLWSPPVESGETAEQLGELQESIYGARRSGETQGGAPFEPDYGAEYIGGPLHGKKIEGPAVATVAVYRWDGRNYVLAEARRSAETQGGAR